MKKLLKQFILLVICSYMAFFLVFNQGLLGGIVISGIFLVVCTFLFVASIIGVVKGKLDLIKLTTVAEAAFLMTFSILLGLVITTIALINSFAVYTTGDESQSSDKKIRVFASRIFDVPSQAALLKTEKNGVTYFYPENNKDEIEKMDELLQLEREKFNSTLGTQDDGGLTIEFHEDYASLESGYGSEEVAGYYDLSNKRIHLVPTDENWELILVHEYSHYQNHLFSDQHLLSITRIPSWFEEGVADYFAGESSMWYDLESIETIDFHALDNQEDYDKASTDTYDPYAQSFLAVESIVDAHGEAIIPELLKSQSTGGFYKNLEKTINMDIEEYEEIFLQQLLANQQQIADWFDLGYQQLEMKNYEAAIKTVENIRETGDIYDIDAADWLLVDIMLAQEKVDLAVDLLNKKIEVDQEEFLVDDLLLLAEVYLLVDPKLSLETAKKAETSELYFYEEDIISVYEQVNSDDELAGYKRLIADEWLYNPYVIYQLIGKLSNDYPGEF
ncbi:collagenase [Planococcus halocryophilus]|uniref:collagenase n=1 Tax=Planococcus halocryophilus TaxID=1215089 RepID=UPI001F0E1509|nr:collagenase [Planococcus halocryophilus]MCH4827893.1 collagenase [Planococcus halocryophilus]